MSFDSYQLITPASLAQYVEAVPSVGKSLIHALLVDPRRWRVVAQAYADGLLQDIRPSTLPWMAAQYGAEAKPYIAAIEHRLESASTQDRFRSLVTLLAANDLDQAAARFKLGRVTSDLHERGDHGVTLEQFRVPGIPGAEWRVEACTELSLLVAMLEGTGIGFGDGEDEEMHRLAATSVQHLSDTLAVVSLDDGTRRALSVADVAAHTPWFAKVLAERYAGQPERERELIDALERRMLELSQKSGRRWALLAGDVEDLYNVLRAYAEQGLLPSKAALKRQVTLNKSASSRKRQPAPTDRATTTFVNAFVFPRDKPGAPAEDDAQVDVGSLWAKLAEDGCVNGLRAALAQGFELVDQTQPVQPLQRAMLSAQVDVIAFLVENDLDVGEAAPSTHPDMVAALNAARAHRMLARGTLPQASPPPL